jgi:hypothetical protein
MCCWCPCCSALPASVSWAASPVCDSGSFVYSVCGQQQRQLLVALPCDRLSNEKQGRCVCGVVPAVVCCTGRWSCPAVCGCMSALLQGQAWTRSTGNVVAPIFVGESGVGQSHWFLHLIPKWSRPPPPVGCCHTHCFVGGWTARGVREPGEKSCCCAPAGSGRCACCVHGQ